jgi:hypothetical protein
VRCRKICWRATKRPRLMPPARSTTPYIHDGPRRQRYGVHLPRRFNPSGVTKCRARLASD